MGLFTKSKTDTKRMLKKKSRKNIQNGLQLKRSSSSIDDDDVFANNLNAAAAASESAPKTKSPKKSKFWRLQEEAVGDTVEYIPPPGIRSELEPVDPFASNMSIPHTGAGNNRHPHQQKKKQFMTFQRLDNADDGLVPNQALEVKRTPTNRSRSSNLRPPSNGKDSSAHQKQALPSVDEHQPSVAGVEKRWRLSPTKRNHRVRVDSGDSASFAEYQPPPFALGEKNNSDREAAQFALRSPEPAAASARNKPKKENQMVFLLDVIRHSSSEETFDVRSDEHEEKSPQDINRGIQRSDSGLQSERSGYSAMHSESGFPTASGGHDFQQIIFDPNFHKIEKIAIAKSDAGASDFSDFVKAASQLTKTFSIDMMKRRDSEVADKANPVLPSPWLTRDETKLQGKHSHAERSHASMKKLGPPEQDSASKKALDLAFAVPASLPSQRIKAHVTVFKPSPNGSDSSKQWNLAGMTARAPNPQHDDGGFSVSSTQSSVRSRQEFQAAIRSKARTPLSEQKDPRHHRSQRSMVASETYSLEYSTVSVANATFSNPAHEVHPFAATNSFLSADPFVMASDFNIANFSTDDSDPFHIGEVASEDSAWNVDSKPFQDKKRHSNNPSQHQVKQATSMDDSLIASIRKASSRNENSKDPDGDSRKRDPSPQAVRASCSDSALEYSRDKPSGYGTGPHKNPPKAVPTNAILGSMLFRQTQSIYSAEEDSKSNISVAKRKETSPDDDEGSSSPRDGKVPRSVHADKAAESVVSSVTEEASTFYQKNFGGGSAHWNKQALNVLNHYNVKKTLQVRDTNAHNKFQRHLHSRDEQNSYHSHAKPTPPVTRLVDEPPPVTRRVDERSKSFETEDKK